MVKHEFTTDRTELLSVTFEGYRTGLCSMLSLSSIFYLFFVSCVGPLPQKNTL